MKDYHEPKEKTNFERAWTITTSCASGALFGTAVTPVIGTLVGAITEQLSEMLFTFIEKGGRRYC
jgi:hypothetical protein